MPCKFKHTKWYYIQKRLALNPRRPPEGTVKIYDRILAIYAVKSKGSNFPGEKFCHKFSKKYKASIYGLRDGSLLIKGKKPLWKRFKYEK